MLQAFQKNKIKFLSASCKNRNESRQTHVFKVTYTPQLLPNILVTIYNVRVIIVFKIKSFLLWKIAHATNIGNCVLNRFFF